jgi:hypothetical protein
MVVSTDVPGASGANAMQINGGLHSRDDLAILAHSQVVVAAPDTDFRVHPVTSGSGHGIITRATADFQEIALTFGHVLGDFAAQIRFQVKVHLLAFSLRRFSYKRNQVVRLK